jgi:uncharacterized membrane protein YphA (DoxX/SURF4 family)
MNATRYLPFASRLRIGLAFATSGIGKLAAYGATIELIASGGLRCSHHFHIRTVEKSITSAAA